MDRYGLETSLKFAICGLALEWLERGVDISKFHEYVCTNGTHTILNEFSGIALILIAAKDVYDSDSDKYHAFKSFVQAIFPRDSVDKYKETRAHLISLLKEVYSH